MSIVYKLGKPIEGNTFLKFPTCKTVNTLAQFGLVKVIFPETTVVSSESISILDCSSNNLVLNAYGKPLIYSDIIPNKPYRLKFSADFGGYVIYDKCSCSQKTATEKVGVDK